MSEDEKHPGHVASETEHGKLPEDAALSGAEPNELEGKAPLGQGAQVVLTGDAQAAARGGTHGEIAANTVARDEAIKHGHIEHGATKDAASGAVVGGIHEDKEAE